jgi:hypothetical protein
VNLLASNGKPAGTNPEGNTGQNIGPLVPSGTRAPHFVALLDVDISALMVNGAALEAVTAAQTEVHYIGYLNPDETACDPTVDIAPVTFEHAGH